MKQAVLLVLAAASWIGAASNSRAQEESPPRMGSYWKAEIGEAVYLVPHWAITSISQSQYLVDGAMRVTEVSVGTVGSVEGRFYYVEPVTPQSPIGVGQSTVEDLKERIREVTDRVGADEVWTKVVKNYPTTTHAHTVEFRLESAESLTKLYESLERSYLRRKTETFKP